MSHPDEQLIIRHLADGEPKYDQQLVFDPFDGTLVALNDGRDNPSPDALTALSIAEEGFYGPRFTFRSENGHQGGHHVHLLERGRGGYQATNVCFTRRGETAIAYTHAEGKSEVTYDSLSKKMIKGLRSDGLVEILEKDREWTPMVDPDKVIATFSLYAE